MASIEWVMKIVVRCYIQISAIGLIEEDSDITCIYLFDLDNCVQHSPSVVGIQCAGTFVQDEDPTCST